jgi:hypothetical protein
MKNSKSLSIILWLIALHSFFVGIGLIVMPIPVMEFLGYNSCADRFFPTQGGVFHIIMAIAYSLAALRTKRFECMILFSIIVKFSATFFLFTYYFLVSPIWMVLLSGITDCLMGIVILWAYLLYRQKNQNLLE